MPNIVSDIIPYRSQITGEVIGGRADHKNHLSQHGCEELGNEMPDPTTPSEKMHKAMTATLGDDIKVAYEQCEQGHVPDESPCPEELKPVILDHMPETGDIVRV